MSQPPSAEGLPVGVVLCRACARRCGLAVPEIAAAVQAADPGATVLVVEDLCRQPGSLATCLKGKGLARAVIGACLDGEAIAEARRAAGQAGLDPLGLEVVDLALGLADTGEPCPERVVAQLVARAERARAYEGVSVENVKLVLPALDAPVSRRGLFGLLRPRQQVVPAVDADACLGAERCRLCLSSCPYEAIGISGGRVAIETFRCTGCGVCLPACPTSAIRYPTCSPAQVAAEVRGLLRVARKHGAASPEDSPVLLYRCQCAGRQALPPGYLPVEVPCLAMLSADLLLLPFEEGAAGVLLAAGTCPRQGPDWSGAWAGRLAYAQAVLEAFEAGASRIQAWQRRGDETGGPFLRQFQTAVAALGPHRLAEAGASREDGLPALLARWDRRARPAVRRVVRSDASPLGVVTVDRPACTLCGVCGSHCPTGALAFTEGDGRSTLAFTHTLCVACDRCVPTCPEKAMALERATDLDLLEGPARVLAQDTLARCRACGASLLPEATRRRVQARLSGPAEGMRDALCPACRIKAGLVGQMGGKGVS